MRKKSFLLTLLALCIFSNLSWAEYVDPAAIEYGPGMWREGHDPDPIEPPRPGISIGDNGSAELPRYGHCVETIFPDCRIIGPDFPEVIAVCPPGKTCQADNEEQICLCQ